MIVMTAPAKVFLNIPLYGRMNEILDLVHQRYAPNALDVPVEQHVIWTDEFSDVWGRWAIAAASRANQWLGGKPTREFHLQSSGFTRPCGPLVRADVGLASGPRNILVFEAELSAPVELSDYVSPAGVGFSFQVGENVLPAFEWLLANWRRVLERCWEPFRPEFSDNGYDAGCALTEKPPRGLRILPQIEYYLKHSRDSDPRVFTVCIRLPEDCTPDFFDTVLFTQFSVFDAVAQLGGKRARPDVLLGHFEKLRDRLPRMPFPVRKHAET